MLPLQHNDLIFSIDDLAAPKLATDDILLQPTVGILESRSDALIKKQYVYSSPMDVVTGLSLTEEMLNNQQAPVFCRFLNSSDRYRSISMFSNYENFWYSVGSSIEEFEYLNSLDIIKNSGLNVSVDVAHGATKQLSKIYELYSNASWCNSLMSGTIATVEAAKFVYESGCTHIRVGIGPGSACSTRIVTGVGYPNLSSVYEIYRYFYDLYNISYTQDIVSFPPQIIADGGIRTSSDVIKYLAAGADGVMLGSMLSSLQESEGWIKKPFKKKYKYYRGQASKQFQIERRGKVNSVPEGVQSNKKIFPDLYYSDFQQDLNNAVSSALSYLGLSDINQLNPQNTKFIKITPSGLAESRPHILSN